MKRIRRLLDPQRPNGAWTPVLAAAAILALGATTLAAWPQPPAAQMIDQKSAASKNKAWLNEVAYIIDDAERGAFQRLATDAERDKFIEQFWERRNPTPGATNAFKEEHYRRLAYAERYQTKSGTAGWQTDRGHMYIMYGPPDEIESHPTKTAQYPHPTEAWLYRHVDGIGANAVFTFIDANESGDYRLAPVTDRMLPKN